MCASCGCKIPDDDHGDSRHITWEQLEGAAAAAGTDPESAADNIHEMAQEKRAQGSGT